MEAYEEAGYCFEQTKPQPSRLIIILLLLEKEVSLPGLCSLP